MADNGSFKFRRSYGFTLVEIVVVLAILGIIAAFAIPAMLGFVKEAREKQAYTEIREVALACQSAYTEIYATYRLKPEDQVIYTPRYESAEPWDKAFQEKVRSLLGGDVHWEDVQGIAIMGNIMGIYYKSGDSVYHYYKDETGKVTITKQ